MPLKSDHIMKPVIKGFNYIRSKELCHCQFLLFLLDIHTERGDVYHTDVKWLSWGSALQRFYSLYGETGQSLEKNGQPMSELTDPVWLADFAFLVDVTRHLNALNMSLQGQNAMISQLYSHIKSFWTKQLLFQSLKEIMTCFSAHSIRAQMRRYAANISSLAEEFQ